MQLIFDGGGTKWIEEFSKEHKMTPLPQSLKSSKVIGEVLIIATPRLVEKKIC